MLINDEKFNQYDGLVTNVNIFTASDDLDISKLNADICNLNGNYISWFDFDIYDFHGLAKNFKASKDSVCGHERFFLFFWTRTYKILILGIKQFCFYLNHVTLT